MARSFMQFAASVALCTTLVAQGVGAQTLPSRINDSGQTLCYNASAQSPCTNASWPGQDGSYGRDAAPAAQLSKVGAGAAGMDFTKLSNAGAVLPANASLGTAPGQWGCTRDNVTGLIWQAATATGTSWAQARDAALTANAAASCGRTDWRLPAGAELFGIVNYGAANPAVDGNYFPATTPGFYWTADADPQAPGPRVRVVNFNGGFINTTAVSNAASVHLVSGGAWFGGLHDNGDGTATDPRTGLMWDRCALGQDTASDCSGDADAVYWQQALQQVTQKNAQNWRGHNDWRLPNIKELASLVDASRGRPMIDTAAFPNADDGVYWSSTTDARVASAAWGVFFGNGDAFAVGKATPARIRLVRTASAATSGSGVDALFADGFDIDDTGPVAPVNGLPLLSIDTRGASITHDDYIDADLTIASPDSSQNYAGTTQIKGHGNSTWSMPKKPYKLKLYDKAKLLGMHSDKNWILLANYDDKSLLRNYVAYALGDRIGMAWSPHSGYVEVELNGQYQGIYELIESIRVDSNRVDIEEMDADDIAEPEVTGGYLFELDQRRDCATNVLFTTGRNVPYCIDTPDEDDIVSQQYDYLKGYMAGVESALYNASFADPTTGYAAYIDTASFIDWYLVNELFKNQDAASFSSIWQYKDRNGKLFRGPLWDFDISAGNVNYGSDADPRGFWIRGGTYYSRLFQDPAFAQATRQRWDALKTSQVDTLPALIDQMAGSLDAAAPANFQAWPILDQYTWPNAVITGSYDGDVDYFKDWLIQRTEWLDANL